MFSNNNTYLHLNVLSSFGLNFHARTGFKNRPGNFKSSIKSLIKPMRSWPNFGIFILVLAIDVSRQRSNCFFKVRGLLSSSVSEY